MPLIKTGWDSTLIGKRFPNGVTLDPQEGVPQTRVFFLTEVGRIAEECIRSRVLGVGEIARDDHPFGESSTNQFDLEIEVEATINTQWAAAWPQKVADLVADQVRSYLDKIGFTEISVGCWIKFLSQGSIYVSRPGKSA